MSEGEQPQKPKGQTISFDVSNTIALTRENERQKIELEDLKSKMELIVEKEMSRKLRERGIDESRVQEFLANPKLIDQYPESPRQVNTPAGSAPMNSQQMGQSNDLYKRKFSSDKEMVDALLTDMHSSDPQKAEVAKSYYDAMLGQWLKSKRVKQGLDEFYDPNRVENLPALKDVNGFKVPVDPSEGDIGRIQKAWRMERKRKSEEGITQ